MTCSETKFTNNNIQRSRDLLRLENDQGTDRFASLMLPSKLTKKQQSTFKLPQSPALDRLKAFLPKMQEADAALKYSSKDALSIEKFDETGGPHLEMNLAFVELGEDDDESDCADELSSLEANSDTGGESDSDLEPNISPMSKKEQNKKLIEVISEIETHVVDH